MLHKQGNTHTRRSTQKAVCGHRRSLCVLRCFFQFYTDALRSKASSRRGLVSVPQPRRYTHDAVHTQGGARKRRSVATAGVVLLKGGTVVGARVERSEP